MRPMWRQLKLPLITLIFIALLTLIPQVRGVMVKSLAPSVSFFRQVGESVVDSFRVLTAIPSLARENGQLRSKVNELTALEMKQKELAHENELLRQELSLSAPGQTDNLIAAQVISRSSSVTQQYITVNKGEKHGFIKGMAVVSQGYFIGVVDDAFLHTSRVRLMTSVRSLVPVVLQDSRSLGLLKGGAEGLIVDEIPRDITINPNEPVVTANVGEIVKGGIPVGTVSVILSGKSDVFQSARLRSPVDLSRLELVFGVK